MSTPSSADKPDLDWSQVRETVMMLNLAIAQLGWTMRDGDESVNSLTSSFTAMVENAGAISRAAETLEEGEARQTILENSQSISGSMEAAIVAFQFYDKLSQRLAHVASSLSDLGNLVVEPQRLYNPVEWKALQDSIRAKYTNEADKILFDAVLKGASIEEAHKLYDEAQKQAEPPEDIVLF